MTGQKQTRPIGKHGGRRTVSQHTRADGNTQTANRVGGKFDDKARVGGGAAASAFGVDLDQELIEQAKTENGALISVSPGEYSLRSTASPTGLILRDQEKPFRQVTAELRFTDRAAWASRLTPTGAEESREVAAAAYEDLTDTKLIGFHQAEDGQMLAHLSVAARIPNDDITELAAIHATQDAYNEHAEARSSEHRSLDQEISERLKTARNPGIEEGVNHVQGALPDSTVKYRAGEAFVLAEQEDGSIYVVAVNSEGSFNSATLEPRTDVEGDAFDSAINDENVEWETGYEA